MIAPANLVALEHAIAAYRRAVEGTRATPRDMLAREVIDALPACFAQIPHGANGIARRRPAFDALNSAMLALTNTYGDGECDASVVRLAQSLDGLACRILGHPLPWKNHVLTPA